MQLRGSLTTQTLTKAYTPESRYNMYCADNPNPWECPPHASTLDQCLEYCGAARPLCASVTWTSDYVDGFSNCFLESSPRDETMLYEVGGHIVNSTILPTDKLWASSPVCKDAQYISDDGTEFEVTCFQGREGAQSYTSTRENMLGSCVESCASAPEGRCLGVLFEMGVRNGTENCRLLNDTGAVPLNAKNGTVTFAGLREASVSDATEEPTASAESATNSAIKVWNAGLLSGSLTLAVVLAIAIM